MSDSRAVKQQQRIARAEMAGREQTLDDPVDPSLFGGAGVDSWMFSYGNAADEQSLCARITRLADGVSTDAQLAMHIPEYGTLVLPRHPDTRFRASDGGLVAGDLGPVIASARNGALRFSRIEPLQTWVLSYDGWLKVDAVAPGCTALDAGSLVRVVLKHRWKKMTDMYHSDTDDAPAAVAAVAPCWDEREVRMQAFGHARGVTTLQLKEDRSLRFKFNARGMREHLFGIPTPDVFVCHATVDSGKCVSLRVPIIDGAPATTTATTGHFQSPYGLYEGAITAISGGAVPVSMTPEVEPIALVAATTSPKHAKRSIAISACRTTSHSLCTLDGAASVRPVSVCIDDDFCGLGFVEIRRAEADASCCAGAGAGADSMASSVIPLSDRHALDVGTVGGKAAQLAELHVLQQTTRGSVFSVSPGVAVTKTVFDDVLASDAAASIRAAIAALDSHVQTDSSATSALDSLCDAVKDAFRRAVSIIIPPSFREAIASACQLFSGKPVAVRSSSLSEDAQDASSAGQFETYLGIDSADTDAVLSAIVDCWASQYTPRAVLYNHHRQHHQSPGMGVVVQTMVDADVSGVVFTINPVSGSTEEMVINANYGLGETVVSGSVEADTFVVRRDTHYSLSKTTIGDKCSKLVWSDASKKTELVAVSDPDRAKAALSADLLKTLAAAAAAADLHWCCPSDVEFAFEGDRLFFLQCRPVTTAARALDPVDRAYVERWDLIHEFDTPLQSDNEWVTTSNISEMFPGALTPLTFSFFGQGMDHATGTIIWRTGMLPKRISDDRFVFSCYSAGHPHLNLTACAHVYKYVAGTSIQSLSFSILGCIDDRWTGEDVPRKNGTPSRWETLKFTRKFYSWLLTAGPREIKELDEKTQRVHRLGSADMTPLQLWTAVDHEKMGYNDAWASHLASSACSGMWGSTFISMLNPEMTEITANHYADLAALLGTTGGAANVESVDVPVALDRLAVACLAANADFATLAVPAALAWLNDGDQSGNVHVAYARFIERHGHRAIREAEFRQVAWSEDPSMLIQALQRIVRNRAAAGSPSSPSPSSSSSSAPQTDVMSTLRTPLSGALKRTIKALLPRARRGVGEREYSKSVAVRYHHSMFKMAYRELSEKMASVGMLPDADLIYFLTHGEVGIVCAAPESAKAAALIRRAEERRDIHPTLMEEEMDELVMGTPVPRSEQMEHSIVSIDDANGADEPVEVEVEVDQASDVVVVTGTPICLGVVEARARVCLSVADAQELQAGEILICKYTDVGWSPFFPMISGLVTELGALLSHGAVVAREFNIPCIVAAKKATSLIKTGDLISLDGLKGSVITVMPVEDE